MTSSGGTSSTAVPINRLPNDLFVNKEIFLQLFNCDSIWDLLSDSKRQQLMDKYLPQELSPKDKLNTIELLMSRSLTRFSNESLSNVFINLKLQKMNNDLVKALEDVKLLRKKLFRLYEQKRQIKLLNEVITRRRSLLNTSIVTNESIECKLFTKTSNHLQSSSLRERVRQRYYKEMKDIRSKFDSSSGEEDVVKSTADKPLAYKFNGNHLFTDEQYNQMLRKHKRKRKIREQDWSYEPTMETNSITLSDIIMRVTNSTINNTTKSNANCDQTLVNNNSKSLKSSSLSTPKKKAKHSNINRNKTFISKSSSTTKHDKEVETEINGQTDNANLNANITDEKSDSSKNNSTNKLVSYTQTNSCYIPSLPTQPELPLNANPLTSMKPLMPISGETNGLPSIPLEKPPICFFSLLRDIFHSNASNDYRLTLHKLEELVKEKLRTFSPYLGWTSEMVASAMNYLSGVLPPPHLIPLVDYKEKNQQWQWIGGGRDLDSDLIPLSDEWMRTKDEDPTANLISFSQSIPPPAKCQTDWIVRPSSDEEKSQYRKQEAIRYNNPYKAFTYRLHGYESIVGPVKGCGIGSSNGHNSSSPNKAREHSLLVNDRPPFVTLLSLVRDAAARLPNGEGTRADICELLKDSQYLLPTISDQQVNGIVSGALDRLHYEKDPCVKYDVNRKVWIYLHRNRTEAEFERLHEVQIAAAKAKRSMNKASRKSNCVNNQSNALNQTKQLSIISKTTQQAIHQAVTNILNSEALKIPAKSVSNFDVSSSECLNFGSSELKASTTVEKEISMPSLNHINGSNSMSTNSLSLSLVEKNLLKDKTEMFNKDISIPLITKKKIAKSKEIKCELQNKGKKTIISSNATPLSQTAVTLSMASNTDNIVDVRKLLATNTNSLKSLQKSRIMPQTKQAIKVQIPNTITLPLSLPQSSVSTCVTSDSLPTLISVANPLQRPTPLSSSVSTVQSRCMPTKKLAQTPLTVTTTDTVTNQVTRTALSSNSVTTSTNTMHQISIPTSMLFGTRQGSVVLATPGGKYMMATSANSIVLQQNSNSSICSTTSTTPSSQTSSLAVRALQGIRVIPVSATSSSAVKSVHTPITTKTQPSNTQVVMASQPQSINSATIPPQHQFVARIITTSQTNRANVPQTQIVIPSTSSLQPYFLAHTQSPTNATLLQHINSTTSSNEVQKVSIALPPRTSPN